LIVLKLMRVDETPTLFVANSRWTCLTLTLQDVSVLTKPTTLAAFRRDRGLEATRTPTISITTY
jgi:hypothetical protein